jgi:hypothetical protein
MLCVDCIFLILVGAGGYIYIFQGSLMTDLPAMMSIQGLSVLSTVRNSAHRDVAPVSSDAGNDRRR